MVVSMFSKIGTVLRYVSTSLSSVRMEGKLVSHPSQSVPDGICWHLHVDKATFSP